MYVIAALFDENVSKEYSLKGAYYEHAARCFPDMKQKLKGVKACLGYFAGAGSAQKKALSLPLKSFSAKENAITLVFGEAKETDILSGCAAEEARAFCARRGWLKDGMAPAIIFADKAECEIICECAKLEDNLDRLMKQKDYKGALNLLAPLREVKNNERLWNSPGVLCRLGISCSKMAVTLKVKADEVKKLSAARQYREYCEQFLLRGAEIEDGARCASALAYRYYSNVHELTRPGERRDQNLEEQIDKANEWLSRAIEVYPQSVFNNYRKGKLIIEKQAPYLLFGKRSFAEGELRLLREIREVGEEHLASAIAVYESLEEGYAKQASRREYAKALFVLGGYYLDDAYLPVHEYFLSVIAGKEPGIKIQPISKMDIDSARENLEKCFYAETDMPLEKLDTAKLAEQVKSWTRSPVEKLYRLGCARSGAAFIALAEGNADKAAACARQALYYLEAAKSVSDKCKDRKRNTWHISEKIAWAHLYTGRYEKAASLLMRAGSGYIVNTYATALMLAGGGDNIQKAAQALKKAASDRRNLASGLTKVLLAYCEGKMHINKEGLSAKNARLAGILGLSAEK